MSSLVIKPVQMTATLLLAAFLVAGCSGSGSSDPVVENEGTTTSGDIQIVDDGESQIPLVDDGNNVDDADDSANDSGDDSSEQLPGDPTDQTNDVTDPPVDDSTTTPNDASTDDSTTDDSSTDNETPNTDNSDPAVPEPVEQTTTQVDFQIMVPAYQSNALQIHLVWGEKDLRASWVGDELWTASDDFQSDTGHLLTVTFYDDNDNPALTEQAVGRSSSDENWAWVNTRNGEITKGEAIDLDQRFYCNFLTN